MWICHKCDKPVYFAERKQSLGYDWHPECLRCQECGRRLNPAQHADHRGIPYCHVPCYGALFGPELFGHGTRVESHKNFGTKGGQDSWNDISFPKELLNTKLKTYNQFFNSKRLEVKSREVNNRIILEGALRIYWGIQAVIHLKEDDDQRTVITIRQRNSSKNRNDRITNQVEGDMTTFNSLPLSSRIKESSDTISTKHAYEDSEDQISSKFTGSIQLKQIKHCTTVQIPYNESKVEIPNFCDSPQVEDLLTHTPNTLGSEFLSRFDYGIGDSLSKSFSNSENSSMLDCTTLQSKSAQVADCLQKSEKKPIMTSKPEDFNQPKLCENVLCLRAESDSEPEPVVLRQNNKIGSTKIRRRSGNKRSHVKLKRRCSINGHFYNPETSFFKPPYGSQMSIWVSSLVTSQETISLLLEKYKVDSNPEKFALFIVRDNGEQRRVKDDDFPLLLRVLLGPHEDVAKIFLMDAQEAVEISCEVAQFLNLSLPECTAILDRYETEFERELSKIREKFSEYRRRITLRMESLKVRL